MSETVRERSHKSITSILIQQAAADFDHDKQEFIPKDQLQD